MELRHLKYFVAVAKEGNIGRASNILNISQPPLTRQIQQLEQDIGVRLFNRSVKGVELTDAGKTLFDEAVNILSLVDVAISRTRRAAEGIIGRLDVAIFGSGVFEIAPRLLLRFRNNFPDVQIVLHTMNKGEQIEALRQRRINIGFNRLIPSLPDIGTKIVAVEKVVVGVHTSNPLAQKDEISFHDLASEPLVLFPDATRPNFADFITSQFHKLGIVPHVAQVVGDAATGIALVASGFGVCFVPESATSFEATGVKYVSLKESPPISIDISCMFLKEDKSPILNAFLKTLDEFRIENGVKDTL
ncbi:MAG: LysR family transcriptional regulator [Caulobacterales bacterium]|nr:LysR family transcriptional regulator [Caulobacterales bacterium]